MITRVKSTLAIPLTAALILFAVALLGSGPSHAATFTVTNNNDSGAGSLRDAITLANGSAGLDIININTGLGDISPVTALPASTDPAGLTINGPSGGVVIDGSALGASENGLHFHTSAGVALTNVTVRNLTVRNFPGDGIKVCGGDPAFCDDELTDTLIDSVVSTNNGGRGISLDGSPHLRSKVVDSVASENIGRGVNLNAGVSTALTDATVQDTTANNNGSRGIELNASGDNVGSTVTGSTANSNDSIGININAGDNTTSALVTGSTANNNGSRGIHINAGGNTTSALVTGSTANNNDSRGIHINAGDQLVDNSVVDSSVAGNTSQGVDLNSGDENFGSTVSRVIATANGTDGIRVNTNTGFAGTGAKIVNNTASNNGDDGISTDVEGEITENTVTGNVGRGIHIERPAEVHFNRIVNNGAGFENTGAASNAENNWWGCNEGPGTLDCDTAVGSVDVSPWLVLGFAASPDSIPEGGTSTLTGDLTMNSNGIDTAASGSIPDGTDVEFATDFGSVGSSSTHKVTVDGIAQAVLTADSGPGIANVSAKLDNETMGGSVSVTSATPTPTPSPSPPPSVQRTWGDNNCSGSADPVDSLLTLRHDAGLSANTGDCPDFGQVVDVQNASPHPWGDVDCGSDITPVDSLKLLRYDAGLSVAQAEGCPLIGSEVTIVVS